MIFLTAIALPIGLGILAYGAWQVAGRQRKEQWPLIAAGAIVCVVSLGLLIFALWVFGTGM